MGGVTPNPPRHGEGDRGAKRRGGGGVWKIRHPEVYMARKNRREMTLPQVLLWQRLKGDKAGVAFRKQHPIGPYIVDFYCSTGRLVVEVDGERHANQQADDAERDRFLRENGYQVLRVNAADVLKDADGTANAIASLVAHPLHRPADGPPPRAGEDLK